MSTPEILAFDVGGTRGRCCLATSDGKRTQTVRLSRASGEDGSAWLTQLLAAGRQVAPNSQSLRAVSISFGGPVTAGGRVLSMHVTGWEHIDLPKAMTDAFHLPVFI